MRHATRIGAAAAACAALLMATSPAAGQRMTGPAGAAGPHAAASGRQAASGEATQDPPFTLRIGTRIQVRITHEDADARQATNALEVRRARLSLTGTAYRHFDYQLQAELSGASARLLDANVRSAPVPFATLWVGQGKVPFGRQQLTSSGQLQFVDRTLVDGRFAAGRQQGLAVIGQLAGDRVELGAGVYNGNGINQSANPNNRFMTVGRIVVTPLGAYAPVESAHDYPDRPRLALGVAGLNNTLGEGEIEVGITRLNTEGAFKVRGWSMTGEFYREWADPLGGDRLTTDGWYAQAGYLLPGRRHEVAGRYGVIQPHQPPTGDMVETGVAYGYYFRGHSAKVQADLRNARNRSTGIDHREARVQLQLSM
jgi:phosphate-selective porin OprO and OprP